MGIAGLDDDLFGVYFEDSLFIFEEIVALVDLHGASLEVEMDDLRAGLLVGEMQTGCQGEIGNNHQQPQLHFGFQYNKQQYRYNWQPYTIIYSIPHYCHLEHSPLYKHYMKPLPCSKEEKEFTHFHSQLNDYYSLYAHPQHLSPPSIPAYLNHTAQLALLATSLLQHHYPYLPSNQHHQLVSAIQSLHSHLVSHLRHVLQKAPPITTSHRVDLTQLCPHCLRETRERHLQQTISQLGTQKQIAQHMQQLVEEEEEAFANKQNQEFFQLLRSALARKEEVLAVCHRQSEQYVDVVERQLREMASLTELTLMPKERIPKTLLEGQALQENVTAAITQQIHLKIPEILRVAAATLRQHQQKYRLQHRREHGTQTGPFESSKLIELQRRAMSAEAQLARLAKLNGELRERAEEREILAQKLQKQLVQYNEQHFHKVNDLQKEIRRLEERLRQKTEEVEHLKTTKERAEPDIQEGFFIKTLKNIKSLSAMEKEEEEEEMVQVGDVGESKEVSLERAEPRNRKQIKGALLPSIKKINKDDAGSIYSKMHQSHLSTPKQLLTSVVISEKSPNAVTSEVGQPASIASNQPIRKEQERRVHYANLSSDRQSTTTKAASNEPSSKKGVKRNRQKFLSNGRRLDLSQRKREDTFEEIISQENAIQRREMTDYVRRGVWKDTIKEGGSRLVKKGKAEHKFKPPPKEVTSSVPIFKGKPTPYIQMHSPTTHLDPLQHSQNSKISQSEDKPIPLNRERRAMKRLKDSSRKSPIDSKGDENPVSKVLSKGISFRSLSSRSGQSQSSFQKLKELQISGPVRNRIGDKMCLNLLGKGKRQEKEKEKKWLSCVVSPKITERSEDDCRGDKILCHKMEEMSEERFQQLFKGLFQNQERAYRYELLFNKKSASGSYLPESLVRELYYSFEQIRQKKVGSVYSELCQYLRFPFSRGKQSLQVSNSHRMGLPIFSRCMQLIGHQHHKCMRIQSKSICQHMQFFMDGVTRIVASK